MKLGFLRTVLLASGLIAAAALPAAAQTGEIRGTVRAADTGEPVQGAGVQAISSAGLVARSGTTDAAGGFVLSRLAPGRYTVQAVLRGFDVGRASDVTVGAGPAQVAITLGRTVVELDPLVISASRRQEKALSAPAHVESVSAKVIEDRPTINVTEHVRALPGIDAVSTGLMTSNVVARGFNNIFSGALLMITDNRIASVPSLRLNAPYMIPSNNEDIERIEVLLGPASALYGPNSANGVMHIVTRSPFESRGTSISATAGERSIFQGSGRHAGTLGSLVGYKVSGQYFRGDDWEYTDPVEVDARTVALRTDPNTRIGIRDTGLESYKFDGRVDVRPAQNMEAIFSAGLSNVGNAIELTGLGAGQVQDWRYSYGQGRFRWNRLFAQAFANYSDAGDTYLLRTGAPIVDKSRIYVAQLQHGFDLFRERQSFTYGMDYQRTEPRTRGTILGRNEGVKVTEFGGYVQSETAILPQLDFIASGRVDSNDFLDKSVFSPRAALVFKPTETQTARFSYSRAFETPTSNNLFLDLEVVPTNGVFAVRTVGVPEEGLHFRRDCVGGVAGLCMRTNLNPAAGFIPANANLLWPAVVQIMRSRGVELGGIPAPGPTAVGTVLRTLNTSTRTFGNIDPANIQDIEGLEPTITNTFEVGYRGLIGDRLLLTGDIYRTQKENFIGPLILETPSVFFDAASLAAYLGRFMPAAQAAQLAGGIGGTNGGTGAAQGIPLGAVVPDDELTSSGDLYLTYRNFGEVELWGGDVAAQFLVSDQVSMLGSYSFVDDNYFSAEEVGGLSPIALNSPKHKGSVTARYEGGSNQRFSGEARVRAVGGFPMYGLYTGDVEGYTHLDASINYRLPYGKGALFTISGQNLLNDKTAQFIGAPAIGRLVMTRIQYNF